MAREVIFQTWCDPCLATGVQEPGMEIPALLLPEVPGNKPKTVALCAPHTKEFYQPLVMILTEHGQHLDDGVPSGPRGRYNKTRVGDGEQLECPECDKSFSTRKALSGHGRTVHDKSVAELLGEEGYSCPECDGERRFGTPQGLGKHRQMVHGIAGKAAAASKK